MKKTILLASAVAVSMTAFAGKDLMIERTLTLETNRLHGLEIVAGAGHMVITGHSEHIDRIIVEAKIKSDKYNHPEDLASALEDDMLFSLERDSGFAKLVAKNKKKMFNNPEISIHLDVKVPADFDLEIDDGSGHIKVFDISGNITIDDGSGHTELTNTTGSVTIDDGSGHIEISGAYDVKIDDGSGHVKLQNITGDVEIEDGSGDVKAHAVAGDFQVDDGSGSIKVKGLEGEFTLIDDGSGHVSVNGEKHSSKK